MEKIFVKIASYRDAELPLTIHSALSTARHPERLTFGICWQYDEVSYLDLEPFTNMPNIRIKHLPYEESNGCCWARNQCDGLYEGERYMLQIDAHTRFAHNWDTQYIDMLENLDVEKPVLSTYPAPFEYIEEAEHRYRDRGTQKLVLSRIRRDLTTAFKTKPIASPAQPVPSHFIAAGQVFAHGIFCEELMYDPDLYYAGEEISLSARAYTHGYDVFCPIGDLIWHLYQHSMPLHSHDHHDNQHASAVARLQTLLTGDHQQLGRYGLGNKRSIERYQSLIGVEFSAMLNRGNVETHLKQSLPLSLAKIEQRDDYDHWLFALLNVDGVEIFKQTLSAEQILMHGSPTIDLDVHLADEPVSYALQPHSQALGYLPRIEEDLR